jgi:hypothetical protein
MKYKYRGAMDMKKLFALSIITLILLVSFTGCNQNLNGIDKVYSISGGDGSIEINNGMIILTSELEMFVGGDLKFKGDELSGIQNYLTEFYFFLDGVKTTINNNIVSIEGSEDGTSISPDMGTTSAEKIFNAEVWDIITKTGSLHFSLTGTFITGENFEYSFVIDVKDIY